MKIDILTLFPKMFENVLGESMLKIGQKKGKIKIKVHDLRDWTGDRHKTADDKPYGGGPGMVMKLEPIHKAITDIIGEEKVKKLREKRFHDKTTKIVLLTASGKRFDQKMARAFSRLKRMILICGHYEGIDERVSNFVTDELSIGDFILTGGEIPAMAVLDATTRLIPGVLGEGSSTTCESFEDGLLEGPHYTRPREFAGFRVPDVLVSGNHAEIEKWRREKSLWKTKKVRSDLLKKRKTP